MRHRLLYCNFDSDAVVAMNHLLAEKETSSLNKITDILFDS